MPDFDSNDPRDFGWPLGFRGFVPFTYAGLSFPQGVHPLAATVFTRALDLLVQAGLKFPPASKGLAAGCWGQETREVTGGGSLSFHTWGQALDVNAPWNPYGSATPPASPFRVPGNASSIVEPLGLLWGGGPRWGSHRDWMHLQNMNSPAELAAQHPVKEPTAPHGRPFPLPSREWFGQAGSGPGGHPGGRGDVVDQMSVVRIQHQLVVPMDGLFGPNTADHVRSWQKAHRLVQDGQVGPATWATLFR